ncbi:hypothetical protein K438DRAFT_1759154 [Mycena galopus ATCC 62051]|nr:hypothetical protein K438DRAFT_1759154 [Mycena galopus ATCC 62051]
MDLLPSPGHLVAFLVPVDLAMSIIAATILSIVVVSCPAWQWETQKSAQIGTTECLVHNPDILLLNRITAFLQNCHTGVLPVEVSPHRIIAACKAFWAIASLSGSNQASGMVKAPPLDPSSHYDAVARASWTLYPLMSVYSVSAETMVLWCSFRAIEGDLIK